MTDPAPPFSPMPFHGGEYTIHPHDVTHGQEYHFVATRSLPPGAHPEERLYRAEVRFTGRAGTHGLGLEPTDTAMVERWINGTLAGRHLNTVLDTTPTQEAVAAVLLSLSLTVLEARAEAGRPVPCNAVEVSVTDTPGQWARVTALVPDLTYGVTR